MQADNLSGPGRVSLRSHRLRKSHVPATRLTIRLAEESRTDLQPKPTSQVRALRKVSRRMGSLCLNGRPWPQEWNLHRCRRFASEGRVTAVGRSWKLSLIDAKGLSWSVGSPRPCKNCSDFGFPVEQQLGDALGMFQDSHPDPFAR